MPLLERSETLFSREERSINKYLPKRPLHIKDLVNKLGLSKYAVKNNNLLFVKENNGGSPLQPANIASGIKSFGIIQMLLEAGELNEQKMLIIDEPENHLHPKWQRHFAHLLVKLVKNNIPVVVSSHSPYFIQAVKYYSTQEDVASKVDYYLADTDTEDAEMTRIVDVSEDLNQIFIKLAEPLNEMLRG